MKTYQAIVIGAGPAGSRAALALAQGGIDTLLVDRNERPGTPVRCGEGIGGRGLRAAGLEPKPEWINARIKRAAFVSPSGTTVKVESIDDAYILNREQFDFDLASMAVSAGAQLVSCTTVRRIERGDPKGWRIFATGDGRTTEYRADLIVAADGVEGRVGRQAGLCATIGLCDIESCAQYVIEGVDIDSECCYFYTGQNRAPGGYAWVFPKGSGMANVGLGILGRDAREYKALAALDRFVVDLFPKARIVRRTIGGVPVGLSLDPLVGDGILLAGDAARQVNCLNGGGLSYALSAGFWAGQAGAEALSAGDVSAKMLSSYSRRWKQTLGKQQKRSYHLKEALLELKDTEIDRIAQRIQSSKSGRVGSLAGVFVPVFARRPGLLWKMFKLLS